MSSGFEDRDRIRGRLDRVAATAAEEIRAARVASATAKALRDAAPWLLIVPALALALHAVTVALGGRTEPGAVLVVLALTPLPALVLVLGRRRRASDREVSRLAALAARDDKSELADRLSTAAAFLDEAAEDPWRSAAIRDAERHLERVDRVPLAPASEPVKLGGREAAFVGASLAMVALLFFAPGGAAGEPAAAGGLDAGRVASREPDRRSASEGDEAPPEPRGEREDASGRERLDPPSAGIDARREDSELSSEVKEARGATGQGRSADASSSSGASSSKGQPTNQGQSGEGAEKKTARKPKKKKDEDAKGEKPEERKEEQPSGATAGRGAASGSNKSPAASPWTSKDQVVSEDEDDLEQDEEVDDEFEDSDARGGVQPFLRDRKPPVNRDLGIGFGNQKNPDANGRGGPGDRKKSRGVAALVLGIAIPDHVKGKPNPGRTKVTQERVEPREEDAALVDAADRPRRDRPVGHVARPDMLPWMRDLVRRFYQDIRSRQETRE